MAGDSAVIVKTRKFKKNPLLARKQVCWIGTMSWQFAHTGIYLDYIIDVMTSR